MDKVKTEVKPLVNIVPMKLQFFGEGGGAPEGGSLEGATPGWGLPSGGSQPTNNVDPGIEPGVQDPGIQDPAQQPTVEELDFGGRKVPVVDPILKDLHQDYTQLNSTYTRTNQQLQQMQQQVQLYEQMMQRMFDQGQLPNQQQQQTGPTPEEMERMKEEFTNQWYEDPYGTFQKAVSQQVQQIVDQQIKPIVEPIQREKQWNTEVQRLNEQFSDFQQIVPQMQAMIQQQPDIVDRMGLENVYWMAKGQQSQNFNPQQLIQDPQFLQQYVFGNEQIKNQIYSQMVQQRQQTNQQIPPVMGNQAGGQTPTFQQNTPKTLREGSKAFMASLGFNK